MVRDLGSEEGPGERPGPSCNVCPRSGRLPGIVIEHEGPAPAGLFPWGTIRSWNVGSLSDLSGPLFLRRPAPRCAPQSHHISRESAPLSRKVKVLGPNMRLQCGVDSGSLTIRRTGEAMPYLLGRVHITGQDLHQCAPSPKYGKQRTSRHFVAFAVSPADFRIACLLNAIESARPGLALGASCRPGSGAVLLAAKVGCSVYAGRASRRMLTPRRAAPA